MTGFFRLIHTKYSHLDLTILDVGSRVVINKHPSYKQVLHNIGHPPGWRYVGLDLSEGNNVDIVSSDPYKYPLNAGFADVIISGQALEHIPNPFKWIKEVARVLTKGGYICLIAPSSGPRHQPVDAWRVLEDGMRELFLSADLVPITIYRDLTSKPWVDCVGVARKRGGEVKFGDSITK
jgi:SAM-dependent methyltransferase